MCIYTSNILINICILLNTENNGETNLIRGIKYHIITLVNRYVLQSTYETLHSNTYQRLAW